MEAMLRIPPLMTLQEFLAWEAPDQRRWQLVDGEPQAMSPGSRTHGTLQSELNRLIGNHLLERGTGCSVIANPGIVPRVRADINYRIPDVAVTCSPYTAEEYGITDPVLVIEVLSPSNKAATWSNVWTYTTIPSVQEILILHSVTIRAELLRRDLSGSWPDRAAVILDGDLHLTSIDFRASLSASYRGTRLDPG